MKDNKFKAHDASSDIMMTKQILDSIIDSQVKSYRPELLSKMELLYKDITGKDLTTNTIKSIFDPVALKYADVKNNYSTELSKLMTHLNDTIKDHDHFIKMAKALHIAVERDVNKKINAQIKNLNKQLAIGVNPLYSEFAAAYATPSTKQALLDIVAYKLKDYPEPLNPKAEAENISKVFNDIAKTLTEDMTQEKAIISSLISNKYNLFNKLNIDREDFNAWKAKGKHSETTISEAISRAYGTTLT